MPYVFFEELPEGAEESDVVSRDDFETVAESVETLERARDELAGEVVRLRGDLKKSREDYSRLVLDSAQQEPQNRVVREPLTLKGYRDKGGNHA